MIAMTIILGDILGKAIEREIQSQRLYTDLGKKVREPAARDVFAMLVREERGHQDFLERYQRGELTGGALGHGTAVDFKVAEHLYHGEISPAMQLTDVFLVAANREKAAHDFYLGLARIHPSGDVKTLLRRLAREELGHKQKMEILFSEVAFPQTDGG
ncbi:MAG: ferritin family protein [Chloroflexi bacterium]|nr:ferritin family protein [Chloroflexota bacterium]